MSDVPGFLFFDLDGTIAESGKDICDAMDQVLSQMGSFPLTDAEKAALIGPPLQDAIPPLLQVRDIDARFLQEVIDNYRTIYKKTYLPHTKAITGMPEVVRQLHRERCVLSVVTTKPQPQAGIALRATGLMECFVTVVGPQENNPTPKDELLRIAMNDVSVRLQTQVTVEQSWMIGDRYFDINAAHAVGATSIAVMWGHGDQEEFTNARAHHVVHSPVELLQIVLEQ